jgi:Sec7-like guanine-nucleotide exchange factor
MPLDARRIEKILEEFAFSYHDNNRRVFSSAKLVKVLAYSVM